MKVFATALVIASVISIDLAIIPASDAVIYGANPELDGAEYDDGDDGPCAPWDEDCWYCLECPFDDDNCWGAGGMCWENNLPPV